MFGKLYHAIAVVSIATVLAGGALLGVMYGTGKLSSERLEMIAALLRDEPQEPEETNASAPTEEEAAAVTAGAASAEELRQQQCDSELRRALAERTRCDLIAQKQLLDQAVQDLIVAEERLERERESWKDELEQRRGAASDAGFDKQVQYVAGLAPKQAKELLVLTYKQQPADAVHLLSALPASKGKRILGQMKSADEIQIMHKLLEQLGKDSEKHTP